MPSRLDIGVAPPEILELSNEEIIDEFILLLESAGASKDTIKAYRSALKDFIKYIGDKPLKEISLRDVISWRNYRLRNGFRKNKVVDRNAWKTTLHYYTLFLNRFFEWLGLNIRIPKIRKPPRKINTLRRDEIKKLLDAARDPLDKIIVKLILDTGLRSREILELRVEDIDFNNKTIHVKGSKYGRERIVVITKETLDLIKAWIKLNDLKPRDKLIPLTYSGLYKRLKTLAKRAGIDVSKIRPHILRHTFATEALRRGLNIYSLQRLLGHSDIRTTQIYLHLTIEDIRREYEKIMENNYNRCINCGREIPVNAIYCPYCGYKVREGEISVNV
ncbi:MAG: integrase [Desulfurococcales archaeon ex4484_58]|nr:MAG: integrase [Desulfurococcales archaeon ex4484_58]